MTVSVDWYAFLEVFVAALIAAVLLVGLYAIGLRLLVVAGRPPVVAPAEFTDAITVISPKAAAKAAKAAAKAAKKNPLTEGQKRVALIGAYASFVLCGVAVVCGLAIIVWSSLSHG
ncbi:MAG TPA: peptidase [Microbacterium sp.]|uniref:peptidase n=1 Tax=Microbacterium sp. TaxID=51671 RepID=UPI002B45D121|nr:peptidase [Microbacterium sp.]HKT55953.1 peptidase [Microbacterium sp.]